MVASVSSRLVSRTRRFVSCEIPSRFKVWGSKPMRAAQEPVGGWISNLLSSLAQSRFGGQSWAGSTVQPSGRNRLLP